MGIAVARALKLNDLPYVRERQFAGVKMKLLDHGTSFSGGLRVELQAVMNRQAH
ncbi:MAG: hypothetical protein ACM359_06005 [Bacillota bacterium]